MWRRWDLHVHTPESFENSFGGWERYIQTLEAIRGVAVLGVTDYFFIDGYRKLRELRASGKLQNFDLLLPNVELRLGTFIPKRSDGSQMRRLNFHVIFSDELSPDVIQQQFINALHFQIEGHPEDKRGQRNVTRQAIEEAGRLVKPFQPAFSGDTDFVAGCKVITFDVNEARDVLQRGCFVGKYLLFLASENWDQISWNGQDYLTRKNLLQSSHGLFCGQSSTISWCLGRLSDMTPEQFITEFGALKPCVHGSDAHTIAKICKPDDDKFCWVKADPTFEGLKQIVYEPSDRVYIGPSAPLYYDESRVISSVILTNASGWFDETELPLNVGLVSIIGQKGSGKSALAELIARAASSWETDDVSSFIQRAGSFIDDLCVRLRWSDGTTTSTRLGSEQGGEKRIRYLSQKFVEHLCSDDHIGAELIREIEAVIFACTDPTETLNASDFQELRAIRTEGIRAESERLRADVIRLIREECSLNDNAKKLEEKKARIKTLQEEETGLLKQMPTAASPEEQKAQADLQTRRMALTSAQQVVAADKQRIQKVSDIRTRVSAFNAQIARFTAELETLLKDAGIPDAERGAFRPAFPGDTEAPLARRVATLRAAIAKAEGPLQQPPEGTINWLLAQINALTAKESADKARQEKIKTIQIRVGAIGTEIKRLEGEIAQIEGPEKLRIAAAYRERLDAYLGYFRNLQVEHQTLAELYTPVNKRLASESTVPQEQDLEFSIRWEADLNKWLERGSTLFDQRRTLPYGTFQA